MRYKFKPDVLPKSLLEDLYLNQKLSVTKIGEKLNQDRHIISFHLKKYNISIRDNSFYKGKRSHRWKGYEEIDGKYWNSLETAAKKRNIEFSISIEEAWDLFVQQNRECALTRTTYFL